LRRLAGKDTNEIISELASSAEPLFDPNLQINSLISAITLCRKVSSKLQNKIEEESEILLDKNPYQAFKKLKLILRTCKRDLGIIDPYTNEQTIERYIEPLPESLRVRLLTRVMQGDFKGAAITYKQAHPLFEVRTSDEIHDRYLMIDRRAWIIGQSLKDAGTKAPVSIVELKDANSARRQFDKLWLSSGKVV
jgi:hypothetical protein